MPSERDIDEILSRQKIYDVLMRYARGADRCDEDLHRGAFWPDAVVDFGQYKGNAHEFVGISQAILRTLVKTYHLTGNVLIEFSGSDRARVESKVVAYHWVERDGEEFEIIIGGRYLDWVERRANEWRIIERAMISDWDRSEPSRHDFGGGLVSADTAQGARSPGDLIYQERFQLA